MRVWIFSRTRARNENPVVNVVETFRYDPASVPLPALGICPNQGRHVRKSLRVRVKLTRVQGTLKAKYC